LVLTNTVIGPVRTFISGQIQDNAQVRSVDICQSQVNRTGGLLATQTTETTSCQSVELSRNDVVTGTWNSILLVPLGVDYASQVLSIYGRDAAGNRSTPPLESAFWVDTVAPNVEITTLVSSVSLLEYSNNPLPILAGTASDGSGQVEIVVRMTSTGTGTQRTVIAVEDNQWSYFPEIHYPGVYSLSLQARDIAGNQTSLGYWTLQVIKNKYYYWLPLIMR
jgi:hypothetical protein